MSEYRIRATGAVVSEAELRADHPDSVLPSPLTPDALEFAGADAVLEAPAPTITATQTVARNGVTQDAAGNWVTAWAVTDMSADQVATLLATTKQNLLTALAARQLVAKAAGVSYTFPDSTSGIIETDDASITNINGLVTAALVMQAQGDTTTTINFRDAGNVTHSLTAAQTIPMGMTALTYISGTYATKWSKEEEINALSDVNAALAYDVNAGF